MIGLCQGNAELRSASIEKLTLL